MRYAVSHPEADEELAAAALYYEEHNEGLGDDFLNDYENTLTRIVENPFRAPLYKGDNRKLNFRRFPYAVVYSLSGEQIFIKAVMHLHRRPFYWKQRKF